MIVAVFGSEEPTDNNRQEVIAETSRHLSK